MSPASTGKASAKQSRGSNSPIKHEVKLYGDLPDATVEATSTFEVINDCIYSNKWLGDSGQDLDMMICECRDEFVDGVNHACGENSDCINRLTLMECVTDDCGCQGECQNQRFQKRDYAQVSVFKTENKGYGLRADVDIPRGRFIYEYIGEVIGENSFRTRNSKYPGMGIKHFYFMSLERDQFIDATIKGSIARFVNHSCNPNCETEKWVVGNKFRMGIFAKRDIKAGEELAFDYNVDRYGADKVECFCGEPNCLGYIGGKTQTGGPAQISDHLRDALGIDDDDEDEDGNDIPATKKGRKKRIDADDGEFLINAGKKPLSINGVSPVMTQLTSSKEKWIVSKLIARIQNCDDEAVLTRVLQFRPYFVIGKFLTTYKDDDNIILSILATFMNLPRITKNKITVSGIEPKIEELTSHPNEEIASKAKELLQMWSALETSYRIPRRVANDNPEQINTVFLDRARDSRSTSRTESPKRSPKEPIPHWLANKNKHQNPFNKHQGPQNFTKQPPRGPRADRERGGNQFNSPARFGHRPRPFDNPNMIHSPQGRGRPTNHVELPRGWYKCYQQDECYYYSNDGQSTYDVPTQPCTAVGPPTSIPPPPSKRGDANDKVIQQLIQEVTANAEAERRRKDEEAQEKERAERRAKRKERDGKVYDKEKTEKYLAISFAKHVPTMVNKYKLDLGSSPKSQKESVKRYSKTIVGLLVDKEMRYHDKIVNPLNVCDTESKVAKVKLFVYEYMEKVIAHRKSTKGDAKTVAKEDVKRKHEGAQDGDSPRKRPIKSEDIEMNDASIPSSATISGTEDNATRPTSPSPKRKRDQRDIDLDTADTSKRHKATDLPNDRSSDQPSDRPSDNHDRTPSDQLDIESEPKIESSRVSITNGAA
ncbi:hypothetical protein BZA77DRAFT_240978 [Pyronema omphalodes]|nr:hypothetical protein BZA77DRAFT_240978 [Pyronema omphalodes]